jgi:hypothetical protein
MDDEGYWLWQVAYENAGVFSARCPGCGRRMSREGFAVLWNEFMETYKAKADCRKCGEVSPVHLCWPGEYE